MEEWKHIPNTINYAASNYGRIKNENTDKILRNRETNSGYQQVCISFADDEKAKNYYVHRLVAITWLENQENKEQVNHKDGNKLNNCVDNLEWATESENQLHRYHVLGTRARSGRKVASYTINGELVCTYNSIKEAADSYNASRVNIDNALKNKQKTAYGLIWKYLD